MFNIQIIFSFASLVSILQMRFGLPSRARVWPGSLGTPRLGLFFAVEPARPFPVPRGSQALGAGTRAGRDRVFFWEAQDRFLAQRYPSWARKRYPSGSQALGAPFVSRDCRSLHKEKSQNKVFRNFQAQLPAKAFRFFCFDCTVTVATKSRGKF